VPLLELVPRSFGEYVAAGGGRGLQTALAAWPVAVIQEITQSGLRGRGGAGFPTGGVGLEEIGRYLDVGALAVGLSGLLVGDAGKRGPRGAAAARQAAVAQVGEARAP
jgi:2-keto-3-deoxy-6-phosphogluconate aldolase